MKRMDRQTYLRQHQQQKGAVSLFVVIFTALLIATITISFMQLMVKDQQQASNSDLSESAYDSATAGVEDAKRLLLMQQDCIGVESTLCSDVERAVTSGECTTLSSVFGGSDSGEAAIIKTEGDRKLEQSYTCVKITQDTNDYLGAINADVTATLIPLRGQESFDTIVVSWALNKGTAATLPSTTSELPVKGSWPETHPALLRTQLINGNGSFSLSNFDNTDYSNTLFLYPTRAAGGLRSFDFFHDGRRSGNASPQAVRCTAGVASGEYACRAALQPRSAIGPGSATAFLNLIALYNATDYRIELKNGGIDGSVVKFDSVQPEVDSTGRANDLFRRVVSRVQLNNTFNYPVAALEARHSICKVFSVTTEAEDYDDGTGCDPES